MQQNRTTRRNQNKLSVGQKVAVGILLVLCALFGAALGLVAHYPQQVGELIRQVMPASSAAEDTESDAGEDVAAEEPEPADTTEPADKQVDEDMADSATPTRLVASHGKLKIYSPIAQEDLTGVLFHQASYNTALVMETKLPDADLEKVSVDHPVRVNHDQTEGDWVDADALHLWREQDVTDMDTSIDVGAKAGTTVYAPVTGTVVLVQDYDLYGYVPDVKIHIQPEGHPEWDVVLLHQYDPEVKAGDKVEGGVTPISRVRDIAKDLTDVQLGFYTAADDPGNHSHVQLNNADSPGYRKDSLKGAYKVKD